MYVYVCVCMCVWVCVYVGVYVCVYVCGCVCMYVCVHVWYYWLVLCVKVILIECTLLYRSQSVDFVFTLHSL